MRWFTSIFPWLGGAGLGASQALVAGNCTLPKIGKCTGCGSCAVAAVSLAAWALAVRRKTVRDKAATLR